MSFEVVVLNRSFLSVLLGTAGCCVLLTLRGLASASTSGTRLVVGASLLYLLGCGLVTRSGNVPDNDALAPLVPNSEQAAAFWQRYVSRWSAWNHVRAASAFVACLLFILSLSGCSRFGVCASPPGTNSDALPSKLSQTGRGDANVREFRPQFELWSDSALKRRFIALPAGEAIDSTDMDDWIFPVGTRRRRSLASPADTAAYRTGLGTAFEAGAPENSRLVELMSTRLPEQMPPLATEQVDARGAGGVRAWIEGLR